MKAEFFPNIIRSLPEVTTDISGLKAWLLQSKNTQVTCMEFNEDTEITLHSHEAQWGVVLDGVMELTIEGKTVTLKKGDTYFLDSGQKHSAKIYAGYKDLNLFNQPDRFKVKGDV